MNIVKISENSLALSTGMSLDSFAKTNMDTLLKEKNLLLHVTEDGITTEEYFFDGTRSFDDDTAFFTGKAVTGTLISTLLEKDEFSAEDRLSLINFSKAVDFILNDKDFSDRGKDFSPAGGGIIIGTDNSSRTSSILFINSKIFDLCASNHKEDYAEIEGKFLYKGMDYPSSLIFTRAAASYKALTGRFPFENDDTTKRQEDIFDGAFIPLRLWDSEIDIKLAESIEAALSQKLKQELFAGKRSITDSKSERKREEILKKAEKFNTDLFEKALEKAAHKSKPFSPLSEKREKFVRNNRKYLSVKRFMRRNKNRILATLAAVIVVSWFVSGFMKQNAKLISTKGLTSTQTVHAFYTQIHRADVPNLQETIKGKEMKDLFAKMSGYYVNAKQRLELSPDNGILSPAKWFFYKKTSRNWMFGISQLKIDGVEFKAESDYPRKKDKMAPITEENGRLLKKGDTITHRAEYNFIRQAEAKFNIERISDTITLKWTGKQWKVIKVDGKSKTDTVKSKDFIEEYYSLKDSDSQERDVRSALLTMKEKYDWLPDEKDMIDAAEFLESEYGSLEAEKYLSGAGISK